MKWDKLVRELDRERLEDLQRSVAAELDARRPVVQIGDIHPRMSAEDKEAVSQAIARVLRGEDA